MQNALATIRANLALHSAARDKRAIVKALIAWGEEVAPMLTADERAEIAAMGMIHHLPSTRPAKPAVVNPAPATQPATQPLKVQTLRAWKPCGYPGCSPHGCDNCQG